MRAAAVVVEDTSWLGGHRTIDGVFRPISALLESRGGVVRIRIRQVLVPVEAGGHREEMTHRYAPLARVDVGNLRRIEERQHRRIEARKVTACDRGADHHRRDRLRHRLQRVQVAASIERVPPRVVIVERTRGIE